MPVTQEQREQIVTSAIREINHIATLPEVTLKIIDLVEDPTSTAQDLHAVISNDPALCSRILKVVNSSFYGLPGQIASINRAIVMLGLNAVKNIAIAASLAKLFRGGELTKAFNAKDLWTHSNATAAAAKMLADRLHIGLSDEAYLAGLMHDIGLMVEMQFDRAKLVQVVEQCGADENGVPTQNMLEVERRIFGVTHQEFGAGLCQKWKFPATFGVVTGFHHNPSEAPKDARTIVGIVHIADRLAAECAGGFRLDLATTTIAPEVLDGLKLTAEKLAELREDFAEAVKSLDTSL
jgi:Predicted signal transduction protein